MTYVWLNYLLIFLAGAALLGAVVLPAVAIFRGKGKRKRLLVGAGCCVAAYLALFAGNYAYVFWVGLPSRAGETQRARQARADEAGLTKVGDRAPSFHIKTASGSEFALDKQRGKVVLLNFFATWCGPCLQELPHIQELWKEHENRNDFALLVVGREESDQSVQAFMEKHNYSFPVVADPERSVYSLYAKEVIPRTYLIARDGTICYVTTGFYGDDVQRLKTELARQLRASE